MKKVFICCLAMMGFLTVYNLTGCVMNNETKETDTQIANPWTEVETIDEAIKQVGFEFTVPETIDGKEITYIAVLDGDEPMIEVIYGSEITVRKSKSDSDNSGDNNIYSIESIACGDKLSYTMKGNTEDIVNNVTWVSGEYSYSIFTSEGIFQSIVDSLVNGIE